MSTEEEFVEAFRVITQVDRDVALYYYRFVARDLTRSLDQFFNRGERTLTASQLQQLREQDDQNDAYISSSTSDSGDEPRAQGNQGFDEENRRRRVRDTLLQIRNMGEELANMPDMEFDEQDILEELMDLLGDEFEDGRRTQGQAVAEENQRISDALEEELEGLLAAIEDQPPVDVDNADRETDNKLKALLEVQEGDVEEKWCLLSKVRGDSLDLVVPRDRESAKLDKRGKEGKSAAMIVYGNGVEFEGKFYLNETDEAKALLRSLDHGGLELKGCEDIVDISVVDKRDVSRK